MNPKFLYQPQELSSLIAGDNVTVIDIRDREQYLAGHIPGAVNLPQLFYYLAESTREGLQAMHQELGHLMRKAGIDRQRKVLVYEQSLDTRYGGSCRGFWLLTYAGHPDAGVLDGGLEAWNKAGLTLEKGERQAEPSAFEITPRLDLIATRQQVENALNDPRIVLIDNRDEIEWAGESSSPYGIDFAPRKGRIPGAVWIEWHEFLDHSGQPVGFRSNEQIRRICAEKGITPQTEIILYCFKGSRSSNAYIALRKAGFGKIRIFLGSWNEWSRDPALPLTC